MVDNKYLIGGRKMKEPEINNDWKKIKKIDGHVHRFSASSNNIFLFSL